jgi:asparagine synthase (glutamine-hydrolysing)
MCGICGFFGRPDPVLLRAMTASLRHRGPDDDGHLETDAASLGFRRLSIIDLETGAQPMSCDDDRLHIVYNGEIYNYRELRAELERLGRRFATRCDTEVALHAYAVWGPEAFSRFNGMWAMALLDRRGPQPRLILCRDHFGIKPLFHAEFDRRVVFASEIKAILEDPDFPRRVDEQQLYEYLGYGLYDHNDLTFFEGVRQVPAGAYVTVDSGGVREHRYWHPRLSEDAEPDPAEFRRLFEQAVARRLVADVPVGICLSGGLDSSPIVCIMDRLLAEHVPDSVSLGDRLKTFSAIFPGDPIDERDYIDSVLAMISAEPTWIRPTSDAWLRDLERFVRDVEEPMISTAPYAMWSVMRVARDKVTVLLDGQGGDELLAGYPPYQYVYLRQLRREHRYLALANEAARSRDVLGPLVRRRRWERRHPVDTHRLLRPEWAGRRQRPHDPRIRDDLKRRLLQDVTTFSLPSLLRYEDRNSMAHSMEARLPFLDQELVEWILRLPASAIVSGGWSRRIVREAMREVIPEKVRLRRKKIGFTTPEFRWLRQQRASIQSLMRSPSFRSRPYWDADAVAEAFRRACVGETEESLFFWRTVNVEVWLRVYLDHAVPELAVGAEPYSFARRGDRMAALSPDAQRFVEAAPPNRGGHVLIEGAGGTWGRVPLRSVLVQLGDDLEAVLRGSLAAAAERGLSLQDGDVIALSEKMVAVTQRRSYPVEEIQVSPLARFLVRFVHKGPLGIGIGRPVTMQLALDEAGAPRILLAAACSALARPFGRRGVFYRVAGSGVSSIDGPADYVIPPYNRHASKAPRDPDGVCHGLRQRLAQDPGVDVHLAIVDSSDLACDVLGASRGADRAAVAAALADNPMGQTDQQTPFCLIRRLG